MPLAVCICPRQKFSTNHTRSHRIGTEIVFAINSSPVIEALLLSLGDRLSCSISDEVITTLM
jgi:hypothetical protein